GADQKHVVTCERGAHRRVFNLAVPRNCAHLEIVGNDEMLVAELFTKKLSDDVVIERRRFEQTAGSFLSDVNVWKTTVTDHHAAHAIVSTLKELDIRCEVLRDQIVVRQAHDRHLFVRVDFACSDAWKMFQTTETAGALKTAHVDGCVAEHFARRTPIRSRIESVRE